MTIAPPQPAFWGVSEDEIRAGTYEANEGYQAVKNAVMQRMIAAAEHVIPGLRDHLVFQEAATPLTHTRYTGRPAAPRTASPPPPSNSSSAGQERARRSPACSSPGHRCGRPRDRRRDDLGRPRRRPRPRGRLRRPCARRADLTTGRERSWREGRRRRGAWWRSTPSSSGWPWRTSGTLPGLRCQAPCPGTTAVSDAGATSTPCSTAPCWWPRFRACVATNTSGSSPTSLSEVRYEPLRGGPRGVGEARRLVGIEVADRQHDEPFRLAGAVEGLAHERERADRSCSAAIRRSGVGATRSTQRSGEYSRRRSIERAVTAFRHDGASARTCSNQAAASGVPSAASGAPITGTIAGAAPSKMRSRSAICWARTRRASPGRGYASSIRRRRWTSGRSRRGARGRPMGARGVMAGVRPRRL